MQEQIVTLRSKLDPSVNIVIDGSFETRFVVRDDAAIVYLSSFKGCSQACRMCHLTQNGQTDMTPATLEDFLGQAKLSLKEMQAYYETNGGAPAYIHYNFMARGEPLLNPTVMDQWDELSQGLIDAAREFNTDAEILFKISSIIPVLHTTDKDGIINGGYTEFPFKTNKPEIYYSLYSIDPEFRRRWIPNGQHPKDALRMLASYGRRGGAVRIHGAFIEGHNDSLDSVLDLVKAIKYFNTTDRFNIVRFNSPDENKWIEASEEQLEHIRKFLTEKGFEVQMVDRVGADISASCGTFVK